MVQIPNSLKKVVFDCVRMACDKNMTGAQKKEWVLNQVKKICINEDHSYDDLHIAVSELIETTVQQLKK